MDLMLWHLTVVKGLTLMILALVVAAGQRRPGPRPPVLGTFTA